MSGTHWLSGSPHYEWNFDLEGHRRPIHFDSDDEELSDESIEDPAVFKAVDVAVINPLDYWWDQQDEEFKNEWREFNESLQ